MDKKFKTLKEAFENTLIECSINKENNKAKEIYKEAKKTINESKILKSMYLVYTNLGVCDLQDKNKVELYIRENMNVFSYYSKKDILKECDKLAEILNINETIESDTVFDLIMESTKDSKISNIKNKINLITEMVDIISDKNGKCGCDKKELEEDEKVELTIDECKEKLAEINEKYSFLNEKESAVLKAFVNNDSKQKENIFESLKKENINFIKRTIFESEDMEDNLLKLLKESESKLKDMNFSDKTTIHDFIKLLEFNK